ncbi:hypothetical protein BDV06DRAFT_128973 [Aspergillus oleicola]
MSGEPNLQAETFRRRIKELISEADGDNPTGVEQYQSKDGKITYIGNELGRVVGELMKVLGIDRKKWGYSVWRFPNTKPIRNPNKNIQVVSLSDKSSITPGGPLTEFVTTITHEALEIGSGTTILVFLLYT